MGNRRLTSTESIEAQEVSTQINAPIQFGDEDVSLGDIMRGERATLGKSLLDVQRDLRISAEYLVAIENADASQFKAAAFISGYVKSYARYLGLDPEHTLEAFCKESGFALQSAKTGRDNFARKASKKSLRTPVSINRDVQISTPLSKTVQPDGVLSRLDAAALGSVAVLVGLVVLIGYGAVALFKEVQQVRIVPVEEPPIALADFDMGQIMDSSQAAINETSDDAATTLDRFYEPQALDIPVVVARDAPISSLNPMDIGAYSTPTGIPAMDVSRPQNVMLNKSDLLAGTNADTLEQNSSSLPQVIEEAPKSVKLVALKPAWVRVTSNEGTVLIEKIMQSGETYELPSLETPPTLRAGMSGYVYFQVGNKAYGPLGKGTTAVKNVTMAIDVIEAEFQPVDLTATNEDVARLANLMVSKDQDD